MIPEALNAPDMNRLAKMPAKFPDHGRGYFFFETDLIPPFTLAAC